MSIHEVMADSARQVIEAHPVAWSRIFRQFRERLNSDPAFADDMRLFSDTQRGDTTVEWFYACQCLSAVMAGDIAMCAIVVGSTPLRDERMEQNNAILQAAQLGPFLPFAERRADCDGSLEWKEPVKATRYVTTRRAARTVTIEIAPWWAPLEVGYTCGDTSYRHLWRDHGLARWCYGSDRLYLARMLPHAVERLHLDLDALLGTGDMPTIDPDIVQSAIQQLSLWN